MHGFVRSKRSVIFSSHLVSSTPSLCEYVLILQCVHCWWHEMCMLCFLVVISMQFVTIWGAQGNLLALLYHADAVIVMFVYGTSWVVWFATVMMLLLQLIVPAYQMLHWCKVCVLCNDVMHCIMTFIKSYMTKPFGFCDILWKCIF